jgi:hypothetical protein
MLTGLLLGAGASFEVGMPLVSDLTTELKQWLTPDKLRALNADWRSQGGGYLLDVIEDLVAVLPNPAMHYETVLGYLEAGYMRPGRNDVKQRYHGLYALMVEVVYALLYLRHVKNAEYINYGLRYVDGIIGLSELNRPLWVFSLNHDLIVEYLCASRGVPVTAGFTKRASLPVRDTTGSTTSDIPCEILTGTERETSGPAFFQAGARGINLLKVHGGLDIFTFHDGKDLLRILPTEQSAKGWLDSLRAVNDLKYIEPSSGRQLKATNEIAYEDENGAVQFLRRTLLAGAYKFDQRHAQVLPEIYLSWFESFLDHVAALVCIGYGFGDAHINNRICRWLEFDRVRNLEIVSLGITTVPAVLSHLATQIEIKPTTSSGYLERYSSRQLSAYERLLKGVRSAERRLQKLRRGYA